MKNIRLSRRGFLRLSAITAGSALAAACQKALKEAVGTNTPSPSPTPSVTMNLGGNQDAWTWVKQVRIGITEGECEAVTVQVNEQEYEAQPEDNFFMAEIPLSEGENQINAVCLQPGGGEIQSDSVVYTGRLRQVPTSVIQIALEDGLILLNGSESVPPENGGSAIAEYHWSAREDNPAPLPLPDEVSTPSISMAAPTLDGEYYLSLRVVDEAGKEDTSTTYFVVENGEPRIPDYDTENPAWVEKAIVYGVLPYLFDRPAFQAIRERLDDLADLGINALWLAPINVHPADDSGWAVEDHFTLEPDYGTAAEFRALVQAAHERGIRVLMDFVPNHSSNTHPYFRDAEERGQDSPYWDFYNRDASGNPTYSLPAWTHLPDFNYENPEVQRMMIEAFSYWVRDFDVDGFRVDAAWAIRERRPEFWLPWRRELKRIKPDLLLLAEATAREPYYFENGFDAAYDWTYAVGAWAWRVVWDAYKLRLLSYNLTDALTNRPEGFHPDALIFRFINNNDTGERFITRLGEGITRVATAMLLTLPGIPCIYTGDEYGLEFEPYQRLEPLVFEEQVPGLREYHKKLIALRTSIASLHSRQFSLITPDPVPQTVFSYIRYNDPAEPPAAPVIVLLNFSEEPAEFTFDVPEQFGELPQSGTLFDLLAEEVPAVEGGRMHVSVPAQTARILAAPEAE